jgi:hypothetical protein
MNTISRNIFRDIAVDSSMGNLCVGRSPQDQRYQKPWNVLVKMDLQDVDQVMRVGIRSFPFTTV